jgi:prostaglandin-H2 D-isomerase / glutathione transferase
MFLAMSKPTLTYFDFSASRGDECRMALSIAGVDFIDNRLKREQWLERKPNTPFGSAPIFEIPGKPALAQSNAILSYIGREYGLLPTDSFETARHEALMAYAEELRHHTSPILRISDETEKLKAREELATKYFPAWATNVERQLGDGPFVGGAKISVADVKLYMIVRWVASGAIDHVAKDTFARFEKLSRLYRAVAEHPKVAAWVSSH